MTFLPVVAREMTVLARRRSTYWSRAAASVIAVLVMFWGMLVSATHVSFAEMGSSMFLVLSSLCFGFALLVGMQATADCLSEEKREGTLGLLFLTDLSGLDVVLGKLAASSLNAGYAFLGVLPMLSLAMLLGGVSLEQFGLIALVLVNTMFLSLAIGVFVSALSKNERKSMMACFVVLFAVTAVPFIVLAAVDAFHKISERIIWPSPLYAFMSIHSGKSLGIQPEYVARSLVFQHLLAWLCLFAASRILPKCISELPGKQFIRVRAIFHDYVFGKVDQRKRHRAMLLDRNAFLWLASRERVKPKYAWGILAFFLALFLWVSLQFSNMLFDLSVALSIIFLVHFIFKIWVASEVCSRLIDDRRSGALELLLSSPLSVSEIAEGQGLALRRIFLKPVVALIIAEIVYMIMALDTPLRGSSKSELIGTFVGVAASLILDLWALKWVGLWLSLFGKSIERVLIGTLARVLAVPWLCFAVFAAVVGAIRYFQDKSLSYGEGFLAWSLIGALFSTAFGLSARFRFLRYFRRIASDRFDLRVALPDTALKKEAAAERQTERIGILELLRRHWFVSGATALILLVFATAWGRQLYWKRKVTAELARVKTNQLPANGAELAKYYPIVSTREDAFATIRSAGPVLWPGGRRVGWGPTYFGSRSLGDLETKELETLRALLTANANALRRLHEIDRFDKGYVDPSEDMWTFGMRATSYLELLWADLRVQFSDKNIPGTISDLRTLIQMARLLRQQPVANAQNAAVQALQLTHRALEGLLVENPLDATVLKSLQEQIERIDDQNALKQAVAVSRAAMLEKWSAPDPMRGPQPPLLAAANGFLAAIGSHEQLLSHVLDDFRKAEQCAALSSSGRYGEAVKFDTVAFEKIYLYSSSMFRFSYPVNLRDLFQIDAEITMQTGMLRAALAALRYKMARGSYPSRLEGLVPEFLDRVPEEPLSGKPLVLEHESGAWQISRELQIQMPGSSKAVAHLNAFALPPESH